jgi:aminopeptidase N
LRSALLVTLGKFGDDAVVAEARKRFAGLLANPDSLTGSARQTVIGIVARHADAATWDQLHALAKGARDATERTRLYANLGAAEDPVLADRALALALTDDPSATDAPGVIGAVAGEHPDQAWDFVTAHRAQVEAMVEPTSRTSYFTNIASGSGDAAMPGKLEAFARTTPASARGEVEKALAAVRLRREIIEKRLPDADRWIAANGR